MTHIVRNNGDFMSIGERISELRKKKEMSQIQLAEMLEVSRQAVSKWENDTASPDTIKLIKLSDVLDTDVEYLATGKHSVPKVVTVVEKVDHVIEKIVEKPVEVERIVEVEKLVEVERIVETVIEKPVIRKVRRTKYIRNPIEFGFVGLAAFLIGVLVGFLL